MNWLKSLGKQVIDIPQSWKEGAFSLDIPIFNLGMMSPLNLKKVQQSDLTKVKAVHSLGMKIDGGLNF
ncbi:hypothetical protein IJM86_05695 [bacterium]|nr:hypothetical protein [bacterium]